MNAAGARPTFSAPFRGQAKRGMRGATNNHYCLEQLYDKEMGRCDS